LLENFLGAIKRALEEIRAWRGGGLCNGIDGRSHGGLAGEEEVGRAGDEKDGNVFH